MLYITYYILLEGFDIHLKYQYCVFQKSSDRTGKERKVIVSQHLKYDLGNYTLQILFMKQYYTLNQKMIYFPSYEK